LTPYLCTQFTLGEVNKRIFARLLILGGTATVIAACSMDGDKSTLRQKGSMDSLIFLTRDECVNTATMRANLDKALEALALPNEYRLVDADTLTDSDPRGGYGTPTVLYRNRDLFGLEEPPVPHPAPT
jgi:hypothetical protein